MNGLPLDDPLIDQFLALATNNGDGFVPLAESLEAALGGYAPSISAEVHYTNGSVINGSVAVPPPAYLQGDVRWNLTSVTLTPTPLARYDEV